MPEQLRLIGLKKPFSIFIPQKVYARSGCDGIIKSRETTKDKAGVKTRFLYIAPVFIHSADRRIQFVEIANMVEVCIRIT